MYHEYILEEMEKRKEEEDKAAKEADEAKSDADDSDLEFRNSRVHFKMTQKKVVEIKARSMLSPEECKDTWYQTDEFSIINSINRSTVKMMKQNGHLENEQDFCIRGLENKLLAESDPSKDCRVHSVYAVLKEQTRQRNSNFTDPNQIAKLYREHVFTSVTEAQARGLNDAKDAKSENFKTPKARKSKMGFDDLDVDSLRQLDRDDENDRFERNVSAVKSAKAREEEEKKNKKKSFSKKFSQWMKGESKSKKKSKAPTSRKPRSRDPSPEDSPKQQYRPQYQQDTTDYGYGSQEPTRRPPGPTKSDVEFGPQRRQRAVRRGSM